MARSQSRRPQPKKAEVAKEPISRLKVFEMYVDGAKWLLAIISGLLLFGSDRLKERSGFGIDVWLFATAAALLILSAGSALFYLWQSYTHLSLRAGTGDPDDEKVVAAWTRASIAYPLMLITFGLGLLAFVAFAAANLVEQLSEKKAPAIVAADGEILVAQRSDCLWVRDTAPSGQWRPVPQPGRAGAAPAPDKC